MSKLFTPLLAALALLGASTATRAQTNGNFETQNHAPRGTRNVMGASAQYDDLASWQGVAVGPNGNGFSTTADYLSTNAVAPEVNPQGTPYAGPFTPHSGTSCVALVREPGTSIDDQFITQAVQLVPNHTYRASFYALRRPAIQIAEKLALLVTTSAPTFTRTGSTEFSPAPYASVVSAPIGDDVNWTLVTGTFVSQGSSAYITIGYDRSFGNFDSSLHTVFPSGSGSDYYAVDDVLLQDLGCATPNLIPDPYYYCSSGCTANGPSTSGYVSRYSRTEVPAGGYTINLGNPSTPTSVTYQWQAQTDGVFSVSYSTSRQAFVTLRNQQHADITITTQGAPGGCEDTYYFSLIAASSISGPRRVSAAYPNPATESLTIPEGADQASLLNSQGKFVRNSDASNKINVQSLPAGIYYLQMRQNGKLIKQRIEVKH